MRPAPFVCARVRARLERLLERELPGLDRARDLGHLEACDGCARELGERRALRRLLRELALRDADPDWMHAGLAARLAVARAPRAARLPVPRWRRAAAAAALAAGALGALALCDAWSGARTVEGVLTAAPGPVLSAGVPAIPWPAALDWGSERPR